MGKGKSGAQRRTADGASRFPWMENFAAADHDAARAIWGELMADAQWKATAKEVSRFMTKKDSAQKLAAAFTDCSAQKLKKEFSQRVKQAQRESWSERAKSKGGAIGGSDKEGGGGRVAVAGAMPKASAGHRFTAAERDEAFDPTRCVGLRPDGTPCVRSLCRRAHLP